MALESKGKKRFKKVDEKNRTPIQVKWCNAVYEIITKIR